MHDRDRLVGVLSRDGPTSNDAHTAAAAVDPAYPTVPSDRGLDFALDVIVSAGVNWVPVTEDTRLCGVVAMADVIAGYQQALRTSQRLLADVTGSSVLVEATIGENSPFAGVSVADAPWPRGSVPLSIDRHSQLIAPQSETTLQPGDVLMAVAPAHAERELRRRLNGTTGQ